MDLENIINAHKKILKETITYLKSYGATKGIFIAGSLATSESDAFSDIDLRVVVTNNELDRFVENQLEAPKNWGELLFNQWWPRAHHCVSHFNPFVKLDVFYYGIYEFEPSPWYALPIRIAYDPESIIRKTIDQSTSLSFEIDKDEVNRVISRGIAYAHEAYRRLMRSELFYANNLMDILRSCIILLDDAINGRNTVSSLFSKYEQRAGQKDLQKITESYGQLNNKLMLDKLKTLTEVYCKKVEIAHRKFAMSRAIEDDHSALEIIFNEKI